MKTNLLVRFLEKFLAGKFAFEIYWPLKLAFLDLALYLNLRFRSETRFQSCFCFFLLLTNTFYRLTWPLKTPPLLTGHPSLAKFEDAHKKLKYYEQFWRKNLTMPTRMEYLMAEQAALLAEKSKAKPGLIIDLFNGR